MQNKPPVMENCENTATMRLLPETRRRLTLLPLAFQIGRSAPSLALPTTGEPLLRGANGRHVNRNKHPR